MRLAIGVALVVAVAPLAVHALQAPQAPQAPFTIGALRRDGIVVPFATFDGKSWSIRWPRPSLDVSIPINLTSVPSGWWGKPGPRDTWQAWTGSDPKTLRVRQPDGIDVHCTRQIGLRTDYRPDQPAPP